MPSDAMRLAMRAETRHDGRCMGVRGEKIGAAATGAGGLGLQALPAMLSHYGLEPTPVAWTVYAIGSVFLLIVSFGLSLHLAWEWLDKSGVKRSTRVALVVATSATATLLGFAAWKWGVQPAAKVEPSPVLTANEVAHLLNDAVTKSNKDSSPKQQAIRMPRRIYRIVVSPQTTALVQDKAQILKSEDGNQIIKRLKRRAAGSAEWSACLSKESSLTVGLFGLRVDAIKYQNDYYDHRDDRKITYNLARWSEEVKKYFDDHKESLPDSSIVLLANDERKASTFLGIHNSGIQAWANLGAKIKAIEAIENDRSRRDSCEAERNAAIAKCTTDGSC